MARPKLGTGSVYKRTNRHGNEARTWTISYMQHGRRVREATRTESFEEAKDLLRRRIGEVAGGALPTGDRRRLTIRDLMTTLVDDHRRAGRASLHTVGGRDAEKLGGTAAIWAAEIGDVR